MASPRIEITPGVLRWAREGLNLGHDGLGVSVGVSPERVAAWEAGREQPTYTQLAKIGHALLRPPEFFVRDAPPAEEPARVAFRRLFDAPEAAAPPALLKELLAARRRRQTLLELLEELGEPVVPFRWAIPQHEDPVETARRMRVHFQVPFERHRNCRDPRELLNVWVAGAESADVLVFHASRIDVSVFRGLAVHESDMPLVLLNGGDMPAARLFSLLHELVHLGRGRHDLFLEPHAKGTTAEETQANRVAAEILMPETVVRERLAAVRGPVDSAVVERLADEFRVSRTAAAFRLVDLRYLPWAAADEIRREGVVAARSRESGGGDYYLTQLRNVGRRFAGVVLDALHAGIIAQNAAGALLGTPLHGVDTMRDRLLMRRVA